MKNGLSEKDESLLSLLYSAPTAIIVMDPEGIVAKWNSAAERMFGWKEDETIGWFLPIIPDDKLGEYHALRKQVLQGEGFLNVELHCRRKDGSQILVNVSAAPIINAQDKITGIMSIAIDISRRKKAEDAQQESDSRLKMNPTESPGNSEEMLHLALDAARMGVYHWDIPTNKVIWSDTYRRIFGLSPDSPAIYKNWLASVLPEDRDTVMQAVQHARENRCDYDAEYRIRQPDGSIRWISSKGRFFYDAQDSPQRMQGVVSDITERKVVENTLLKTQYLLAEGQKIAHVGSFEYIAATQETVWTDEHYRIFGLEPGVPSPDYKKLLVKSIHPDDVKRVHRTFTAAVQSSSIFEMEHRIIRPDGTIRWVYILAHPYCDPQGKLDRYIGSTLDITERKQREEEIRKLNADLERKVVERTAELRASEDKYRSLVENTSDCIWETDENARFTYLSPAFQMITGYDPKAFLGKTPFDLAPKDELPRIAELVFGPLANQEPFSLMEFPIHRSDDKRGIVELSAVPIFSSDGSLDGFRGVTRDTTERKRLEEEVQHRERDLRAIMDNIPSLVGYWDKDLRCRFGNHVYRDWFGIDPDKICGMHFKEVIGEEGFRITMPYVEAVLAGHPQIFELVISSTNGSSVRNVLVHYNPDIRDGQVQGFYVLVSDVTPIKIAEEQRRQLVKAESLGRMAGAIAHHFNNQLHAVIGFLEILLDSEPLGSEKFNMMTDAIMASHKAADVSKLMLTYLGQSSGKMENQDLSEICHKGLLMAQALMPRNVSLITEIPFPGPAVKACKDHLIQIVINLVTNAWESLNDQPGTITFSIETISAADIPVIDRFPVDWQPKEISYVSVKIIDTGCGIPKQSIESLFDPFFTTKFTGRGLGLPVVLGVLAAHGGAIAVENGTEKGCTFRFFLPLAIEKTSVTVETKHTDGAVQSGGMVLLIDDQVQVRNMARAMLTRLGYPDILEAEDGVAAVEIFQRHQNQIRFVITDLTMPRMNGWQTLDALRKISPDIPVILSSGYDESQVMEGTHPELPQAFLPKPYKKQDLLEAIQKVL